MSTNPKTVKQRKANMEAMEEYNENHEDDLFGGASITAVKSKGSLFKPSSKTLLADTDSDDDQDVTLCSAKTPVTAYLDNKERRERLLDHMKTPAELIMQTLSPMLPRPTKYINYFKINNIANCKRNVIICACHQVPAGRLRPEEVGGEEEGSSSGEASQADICTCQQEQSSGWPYRF